MMAQSHKSTPTRYQASEEDIAATSLQSETSSPRARGRRRKPYLRFWQKTYLLTLTLFLLALFGGMAYMGWQNQQQTLTSEVEKIRSEQRFIAQNLAQDLSAIEEGNTSLRFASLARSYAEHYVQNGLLLSVQRDGVQLHSNLPEGLTVPSAGPQEQAWTIETAEGKPYLVVVSALPEGFDNVELTTARSMEELYAAWDHMSITLVTGSALVSAVLAIGLYVVLRRLSKPLEKLADTANAYAEGNLEARATKRSDDEVGLLAESLNAMADTAQHHMTEIQRVADQNARMAANLSHEIRTPLTAVRGYAEYLRLADPTPDERDSALAAIVEQSERLQTVSQRMLQLSSLSHDELAGESVELVIVARLALRALTPAAHEAGVTLNLNAPTLVVIEGDAVLLESLVTNLLDNAIKACSSGGIVQIGIQASPVTLTVVDNGRGMTPHEVARIGEPFYRPDKARSRAAGGAGLGAAICQEIAQLHNARLSYESTAGVGTTAILEFTTS